MMNGQMWSDVDNIRKMYDHDRYDEPLKVLSEQKDNVTETWNIVQDPYQLIGILWAATWFSTADRLLLMGHIANWVERSGHYRDLNTDVLGWLSYNLRKIDSKINQRGLNRLNDMVSGISIGLGPESTIASRVVNMDLFDLFNRDSALVKECIPYWGCWRPESIVNPIDPITLKTIETYVSGPTMTDATIAKKMGLRNKHVVKKMFKHACRAFEVPLESENRRGDLVALLRQNGFLPNEKE